MSDGLETFLAAAPWPQRPALRALLAIARRPRGAALLERAPLLQQAASSTLALGRYDDPRLARALGWDADRGRRARTRAAPRRASGHEQRMIEADVCVIGAGAGGAVVAAELAEGGARVVVLEQGPRHDRRRLHRPPARHARAALPRRRADGDDRHAADPPAARPRGRRHDARQLRHLLPHAAARARALARASSASRARPSELAPCFERVEQTLSVAEVTARARRQQRRRRPARRRGARLVARLPAPQRARLRRLRRVRVRLPDRRPSSTSASRTSRAREAAGAQHRHGRRRAPHARRARRRARACEAPARAAAAGCECARPR